jgi:hypothetical protein
MMEDVLRLLRTPVLALVLVALANASGQSPAPRRIQSEALPAAEFARLVREMSEEGGHFPSDNFTSNESSYLTVVNKLQLPLSETDQANLEYVYQSFRTDGLEIGFRMGPRRDSGSGFRGGGFGPFPSLRELLAQRDLTGKQCGFLAGREDYEFVRDLHRKNLIIPVVGDFSGKKALRAVGDFLRMNGYTVTAFYTSNVEMILFRNDLFTAFVGNVRKLPINDRSLFIRAAFARYPHPANVPGYGTFTLLQQIPVFLRDFDEGRYQNYTDLLTTHYIVADKPQR